MASQAQSFVFIDEDQRKKYSKSTLSAINSQVAKYAHAQKQRKPIVKSHSAPSSPPSLGSSSDSQEKSATQDDQLIRKPRRSSQPNALKTKRNSIDSFKSLHKSPQKTAVVPVLTRRKSNSPSKLSTDYLTIGPVIEDGLILNDDDDNNKRPEDLSDLFQNLCRITKYPSYQAFPFFLNLEERRLAHYWFTEVLKDDFGMKLQLEDTFQGELTRYPLAFQVPLRWIIAKAADQLNVKTGRQSLTTVYRSREKALNRLQDVISDTNTPTDEAIGSILQSIIHSPQYRKIHLRGMDAMIESRGGLEAVVQQSIVTCAEHIFLQYTFAEFDIMQLEELESLKTTFFSTLVTIQERAQIYARVSTQMELWAATVDLVDCGELDGEQSNLQKWSYVEQRKRVFSTSTAFGQLVRQPFDMTSDLMRKSRLFAALLQLSAMLCEYDSWHEKAAFIRRLEQAAETTASPDPVTGLPTMMAGAHIFMTGYVSRQVQEEQGSYTYDRKGIPVAMKGIAALKIFGLLLDSMRQRLVQYLQEWLLGTSKQYLGSEDLSAMSAVITQLWLQKTRNSTAQPEAMDYFAV